MRARFVRKTSCHGQSTPKRKVFSLDDKVEMINAVSSGRKKTDVAKEYAVSLSTLSTILRSSESILKTKDSRACSQQKRLKCSPYEAVEQALYTWFVDIRAKNIPTSGATLQQKAKDFACILGCDDFKASCGWLRRYKVCHNIIELSEERIDL